MINPFYNTDLISVKTLNREQVLAILQLAARFKERACHNTTCIPAPLAGKIIANCFFEPSTRTRLSFESAALRLGAQCIGFANASTTSVAKGESLQDSIRMLANYADLLVIRHPKAGAAQLAAEVSDKPVINAGDGSNQHPTQALIDLFTIQAAQMTLESLSIALVGDLKYSRTVHSLIQLCTLFNMRLFLVAPPALALPDSTCDQLKWQGIRFSHHQDLATVLPRVDVVYMTRLQRERLLDSETLICLQPFQITTHLLKQAAPHLKILHPLPRLSEIMPEVDKTSHAYYFEQAANAVYVRKALLTLLLSEATNVS
jgi:aspartate carbamoyltransferase catalytic subunit